MEDVLKQVQLEMYQQIISENGSLNMHDKLLVESIIDKVSNHVKKNAGKYLTVAALGGYAAHRGALGDTAQKYADSVATDMSTVADKITTGAKSAIDGIKKLGQVENVKHNAELNGTPKTEAPVKQTETQTVKPPVEPTGDQPKDETVKPPVELTGDQPKDETGTPKPEVPVDQPENLVDVNAGVTVNKFNLDHQVLLSENAITDHLKNNWGKYALGAAGLTGLTGLAYAADRGALGLDANLATNAVQDSLKSNFTDASVRGLQADRYADDAEAYRRAGQLDNTFESDRRAAWNYLMDGQMQNAFNHGGRVFTNFTDGVKGFGDWLKK